MLPFKTMISIEENSSMPVYVQIANEVIRQILKGRIQPGLKMPGSRNLAEQLGVHRNTIIASYDELEAQGWISVIPAKGSFVNKSLPIAKAQRIKPSKKIISPLKKAGYNIPAINKSIPSYGLLRTKEYELHFDDGCPDVRIAPINLLGKHYKSILNSKSKHKFDYTWNIQGSIPLRKQLVKYLSETRGININIENILITRGSLMAFYLIVKNLIHAGDNVIIGDTNYLPIQKLIKDKEANLIRVRVDDQGLDVDAVEAICKKKKIRALYVVPHHHHPTTVTLSCDRRMKLLMLAEEFGFAIIEDDYDFDFHYKSSPLLPLMSSDENGMVIYAGSFSKCLAPALRLGYVVAPENVIQSLTYSRRYIDRQGDTLMELALARMIEEGELRRHLRKALMVYRKRRDVFCELMQTNLSDKVQFKIPEGGLAVWTKFEESIDLNKMVENASKKGLYMVKPSSYNPIGKDLHASRIGFASMNEIELERSVKILKSII